MDTSIVIDVTKLAPWQKHPAIIYAFDNMSDGQSFIIQNDHDPRPLYHQLLGLRGNTFTWEYIKSGPESWEVAISKNAPSAHGITIGEIVKQDIRKAEVFKRFGIDFCCGGKRPLSAVCAEKGLNEAEVQTALNSVETNTPVHDFNSWGISFLTDYIVNQHHNYIRNNTPLLLELSGKVAMKHGERNPELVTIAEKTNALLAELDDHLKKEEAMLFPYIKKLEQSICTDTGFSSIEETIAAMEQEHDAAGALLHDIRTLSNGYQAPANACNSHKLLMYKLGEFENDLFQHIHLENNILFPKAISLENNM
ncbi:MAG: iron-sulfur cluster repair di-iron protein [Bacteroidetes bacterium]|nr:iron-sulfur cluster repair di-iron protein [Bacteroidota bacterium]